MISNAGFSALEELQDANTAAVVVSPVELISCIGDAECKAAIHLPFL
jgi:hypothetical protein